MSNRGSPRPLRCRRAQLRKRRTWIAPGSSCYFSITLALRVQTITKQFFQGSWPRNAEPFGGFGLVTIRQLNGLAVQLALGGCDDAGMSVLKFAAPYHGQQIGNISGE